MCYGKLRQKIKNKKIGRKSSHLWKKRRIQVLGFPMSNQVRVKKKKSLWYPKCRSWRFKLIFCTCPLQSVAFAHVYFLRQYPGQLSVWRHRLFCFFITILNALWILTSSHDVSLVHVRMREKQKQNTSKNPKGKTRVCGRLEKLQTPPADPYSVFLFLPSKTELVKISAAGAKASLHWHRFKKKKKKSAEGTSLRRECWLFALSPATLQLSGWDWGGGEEWGALTALSAPRVTPVHRTPWLLESAPKKLLSLLET